MYILKVQTTHIFYFECVLKDELIGVVISKKKIRSI